MKILFLMLRQTKYAFDNFWLLWCAPCRALFSVHHKHASQWQWFEYSQSMHDWVNTNGHIVTRALRLIYTHAGYLSKHITRTLSARRAHAERARARQCVYHFMSALFKHHLIASLYHLDVEHISWLPLLSSSHFLPFLISVCAPLFSSVILSLHGNMYCISCLVCLWFGWMKDVTAGNSSSNGDDNIIVYGICTYTGKH